jgi:hypothetical protein
VDQLIAFETVSIQSPTASTVLLLVPSISMDEIMQTSAVTAKTILNTVDVFFIFKSAFGM